MCRLAFDQISVYCGLAELTHKMNDHNSGVGERIFKTEDLKWMER